MGILTRVFILMVFILCEITTHQNSNSEQASTRKPQCYHERTKASTVSKGTQQQLIFNSGSRYDCQYGLQRHGYVLLRFQVTCVSPTHSGGGYTMPYVIRRQTYEKQTLHQQMPTIISRDASHNSKPCRRSRQRRSCDICSG